MVALRVNGLGDKAAAELRRAIRLGDLRMRNKSCYSRNGNLMDLYSSLHDRVWA